MQDRKIYRELCKKLDELLLPVLGPNCSITRELHGFSIIDSHRQLIFIPQAELKDNNDK